MDFFTKIFVSSLNFSFKMQSENLSESKVTESFYAEKLCAISQG